MLPEGRERLPEDLYVWHQTLRHFLRKFKINFSINKSTTITQRTVEREQSYKAEVASCAHRIEVLVATKCTMNISFFGYILRKPDLLTWENT